MDIAINAFFSTALVEINFFYIYTFSLFNHLAPVYKFWWKDACMTMYDNSWLCMTMYYYANYVWVCMTMYARVWLCMYMNDYLWLCLTLYTNVWLCMTMYAKVWLPMTMPFNWKWTNCFKILLYFVEIPWFPKSQSRKLMFGYKLQRKADHSADITNKRFLGA